MKEIVEHTLTTIKDGIFALCAIISIFLSPISGLLVTVGVFIFFDMIFAIYVVKKTQGWKGFSSTRLQDSLYKMVGYSGCILLSFLMDKYILDGSLWHINFLIAKIACIFAIYIEVKSIDETSMKLGNRSLWVVIDEVFKKAKDLKRKGENIIDKE